MDEVTKDELVFVEDKELDKKCIEINKEFAGKHPGYFLSFNRIDAGAVHICYEKLDGSDIEKNKLTEMQEFLGTLLEKYRVL